MTKREKSHAVSQAETITRLVSIFSVSGIHSWMKMISSSHLMFVPGRKEGRKDNVNVRQSPASTRGIPSRDLSRETLSQPKHRHHHRYTQSQIAADNHLVQHSPSGVVRRLLFGVVSLLGTPSRPLDLRGRHGARKRKRELRAHSDRGKSSDSAAAFARARESPRGAERGACGGGERAP